MDGKDAFYLLAGFATILLAGAVLAFAIRATPTPADCIKAGGILVQVSAEGTTCVPEKVYRELAAK